MRMLDCNRLKLSLAVKNEEVARGPDIQNKKVSHKTMNKIRIGGSEKLLNEVTESWITHQVQERKSDRQAVCVQVILNGNGVDMSLSTPQCSGIGGGGRKPNQEEQNLFNRWNDRHLNQDDWAVGNLIAFLKQSKLIR
jgi:hypothetical protein